MKGKVKRRASCGREVPSKSARHDFERACADITSLRPRLSSTSEHSLFPLLAILAISLLLPLLLFLPFISIVLLNPSPTASSHRFPRAL